jgi:hypothetical protein
MTHKNKSIYFDIAHWIIISALMIASFMPHRALAQSEEDAWAEPINLSHSGTATNPSLMIDSTANVHAVWQDEFANFVYARVDDGQWSAPQQTSLHLLFGRTAPSDESVFTSTNPLFIAGPGQFIFAVWVTQQGALYASRVPNRTFNDVETWYGAQRLSSSVTSFTAAVDLDGVLHVAYIRSGDISSNSTGIYAISYGRNGRGWSEPALLYASPYFRSLESAQTNIGLATGGTADAPLVYVAWDNRARKEVFFVKSMDAGASWEPATQIAGPVPDSGLDGPFDIRIGAQGDNILLVWQSGQPEGICTQYFQSSSDAGFTWSEAHVMLDDLPGCALANEFITVSADNPAGVLLLLTNIQGQNFLSAWNGLQWSLPQAQPILSSFEDPEIYTQVAYDCHRATLFGEQLYIVGCDLGGGGDIWVTSRHMGSTTSWFSPPIWSQPELVTSDSLEVEAIEMVSTGDNLIHAFFSQHDDSFIYYTRWDGTAWSRLAPVLKLANGEASRPAIAAGPGDELFLIARSSTGSLYFSRANSSEAVLPSGWSTPVHLPIRHDGKISPADVAWDAGGTIYITYSVPVNDGRGIYLIQSKDRGETWSEPLQVFDGAAVGFEVVGAPSLQVSTNGQIYTIWKQESLPLDGVLQPISLYFARSDDEGNSFSKAESVVDAPVSWRMSVIDGKGNLHQFWQRLDIMKTLWDQASFDGGRSWQSPELFPVAGGIAAVTTDHVGSLHLVDVGHGSINYWLWDGSRWQAEPPARWSLASQDNGTVETVAASANLNGKMAVIFVVPISTGDATERHIFYMTRTITQPPIDLTTQESPTPSALSPAVSPANTSSEGLLTAETSVDIRLANPQSPSGNIDTKNPTSLLEGVLFPLSLLLIGGLVFVFFRAIRSRAG